MDLKSLVVLPPLFFNSEAKTAVAFIKAIREYGISQIVSVSTRNDDYTQVDEMVELVKGIKSSSLPIISGPLISGPIDYILLNAMKIIGRFDFSLNLYYVDVPVGLDASYIIYPPSALMSREEIIKRRSGLKRIYANIVENLVQKSANSKHLLCSSSYIKDLIKREYNYECSVIYPPVDVFWTPKINEEKEELVVGVGKYVEPKHWEEFIQIAKLVKEKNKEVKFTIIGGLDKVRSSREYFNKLRELAGDNVELMTDVSEKDKWDIISRAKIILHCMRNDNFGLGVAESMFTGAVPVMYRATGSLIDISDNGKYGVLYSTVQEAANSILDIMMDDEKFMSYSRKSLERAKEFSYDTFKAKVFTLLDEITRGR
ncbi:glycosyltransferase [Sulfuracidifex tepidarius]|uniref:D-inositol-3-phosphate glycosyltransferase n=1 Tax=Sulfuracidifex tepidarius TaxID=1294262 RepID=A0A510DXD6_9CREN|nr:glycosyltransferase [Sulfuracidifex tepidarius]BBG24891.1 D-inositol-3-phosphate glycosyltransferase [Sulfuracidifex tepidarius]BBG27676.1 D-inositol-3-phosphate glycosyltransferase [Sulfuracidifex tepidarius]